MTPKEKWQCLTNPQTVDDWHISIPLSELLEVPEAVEELRKYDVLDILAKDLAGL